MCVLARIITTFLGIHGGRMLVVCLEDGIFGVPW